MLSNPLHPHNNRIHRSGISYLAYHPFSWGMWMRSPQGDKINLIYFPPFYPREIIFVTSCLLSCTQDPSRKGHTLKGKNLLPREHFFFLLEKTPFSEGNKINLDDKYLPWESISSPKFITKTGLFKYIENFTSKNWKLSDKKYENV